MSTGLDTICRFNSTQFTTPEKPRMAFHMKTRMT